MVDELTSDENTRDVKGKFPNVESAHLKGNARMKSRTAHQVGAIGASVVSSSLTAASNAKHLTMVGVGSAAALGAGTAGIGLVAAGAVMTAVNMGTSMASAYKTNRHVNNLRTLQGDSAAGDRCLCISDTGRTGDMAKDHQMIAAVILPYVISQKREKLVKKGMGGVGLSLLTSVQRMGRAAYKGARDTKGKVRTFHAHVLARHAVTHDCWLAKELISELFSPQDYVAISMMDTDAAGPIIASKMKSV